MSRRKGTLTETGVRARMIMEESGVSLDTAYRRVHKEQGKLKHNYDRHLCESCKYQAKNRGCDFYMQTDKERGCDPEECTKYVKSERAKGKDE